MKKLDNQIKRLCKLRDYSKNYVGSAKDIIFRINRHKYEISNKKHNNKKMENYFIKNGLNNLCYNVLIECEICDLIMYEQKYIDEIKPYFNILKKAYSLQGYKHSIDAKNKIREKNTGRKMTKEQVEKGVIARIGQRTCKGIKRTDDFKKKLSAIKKKKVIYNNTVFDSLIELSSELNIKYQTLYAMITNRNNNYLNIKYYA